MAIDWGTIPTWVSGLGSTGALWVGAVTPRRAQDKERRSEADAVVCRDERGNCCGYGRTTTHWIASTTNGGGRPVHHVFLVRYNPAGKPCQTAAASVCWTSRARCWG
ncbi:hypothetical protein [Streptomyces sp. MA15]|uniref:hypothetical protein n=1 Tax=Streptomyces sp. MA15 TaxID=3055061 RepID=UPI0025AEEF06|nr:hypothetical protein [Streptomyces sp. MA15]MDN3271446.1 hypothetical protein [Streptomyces sp. MA15]